jgi:hypothetical protein
VSIRRIIDYPIALAGAATFPVFVWWLGWYPGFASSDTIDQFTQIGSGAFTNFHPAIHTLYLAALSLGGEFPAIVTLFQLVVLGVLLVFAAIWLTRSGVPGWLAVTVTWTLGVSPAIAPTTLALWKDIPFGLFVLWAWIELLAFAVDPKRAERLPPLIRLGVALAGIWLFRGNGPLTVIPVVLVLIWVYRENWRAFAVTAGVVAALVVLVVGPLYTAFDVQRSSIEPAQVFLPDVAASLSAEPETFEGEDIELLEEVAPLSVWTSRYDCYDSTPLLFDPQFDQDPVRRSPDVYRELQLQVLIRDLDSVFEHRACAANFVYWPAQPEEAYFHRPPYDIPSNEVGLARDARATWASDITDRVWRWAEVEHRLWLTWRPAIVILPALISIVVFAVVRPGRVFLIPSALFLAHLVNVVMTSPAQEFRYAYPLYLTALPTIALLWPTVARWLARRHSAQTG